MSKKEIPAKVYSIILLIISIIAIVIFFAPLVLGLLLYFNAFDLGKNAAEYMIGHFGLEEKELAKYVGDEAYVMSLYRLIGLSILTFVPFSAYGLVIAVGSIFYFYGIGLSEGGDLAFLGIVVAALTAVGMAIAYWVLICQEAPGYSYSILTMAKAPMNFGYKLLFYIFPIISILIEGLALLIGFSLTDHIGFDDVPLAYPLITLFGVALGGGLIALLYFAFVKILIFLVSIIAPMFLIFVLLSSLYPSERSFTDGHGKSRKYHETVLGRTYVDDEDAKSWED